MSKKVNRLNKERSAKPPLIAKSKQRDEGYVLNEKTRASIGTLIVEIAIAILLILGLCFLLLTELGLLIAFLVSDSVRQEFWEYFPPLHWRSAFQLFFILVFAPAILLCALIAYFTRNSYRQELWTNLSLLPGELIFTHYPLRLGERNQITFRRQLRRKRTFSQNASITIKLFCFERVSYTIGTDTTTEVALIEKKTLRSQSIMTAASNQMICKFELDIPKHLPSSFEARNNQIRWVIVVDSTIADFAGKLGSDFTLLVEA